ncbi:hypothetical protein DOTSEDRAFT_45093, partial [Dothistroma septosporum NZE10]
MKRVSQSSMETVIGMSAASTQQSQSRSTVHAHTADAVLSPAVQCFALSAQSH